jgi:glutamine synthetase
MQDLDETLWKLGVLAKTEHNEVAPAQHELAPIYNNTNVGTDHNQLTMEMMKKVASEHGMMCLLHEKPFAGVNGSGKHNNWSIATDTGANLLEPGASPSENAQFLLFLAAVIKAVDEHQDLLRISCASAGNDHRLGASEAPPAIISMFLGEELTGIVEALIAKATYNPKAKDEMNIGVAVLPHFFKDTTDRNRTSPFAFTGNKFEFRMVGSAFSIADPNTILNTAVAESLRLFADKLEKAEDFNVELNRLIRHTIRDHKRIIFNGNNYADEWVAEAAERGLLNWKSSSEAIPHLTDSKNVALFKQHNIFTGAELHSREDILLENYVKVVSIEALTMLDMVNREILPAVLDFSGKLAKAAGTKAALDIPADTEKALCGKLSKLASGILAAAESLDAAVKGLPEGDAKEAAAYTREKIFSGMGALRAVVDEAEPLVPAKEWPYPSYGEMLFSVR